MCMVRTLFDKNKLTAGLLGLLLTIALLLLTGCGNSDAQSQNNGNSGGSTASQPAPTPTQSAASTPTQVAGYATTQGCPSDAVVTNAAKANVTVLSSNGNIPTVFAHSGDVVEFRFPFGQRWGGPAVAPEGLTLQHPAGYALKSDKVCVWRFNAQKAGTHELHFSSRPICKPGAMCPMHIIDVPVTIVVK